MADPPNVATHHLCVTVCGAKCCRDNGGIRVRPAEVSRVKQAAKRVGVKIRFIQSGMVSLVDGRKPTPLFLLETAPDRVCLLLDRETNECRIYEDRPDACRRFPSGPVRGCLVWPGGDGDPFVGPELR